MREAAAAGAIDLYYLDEAGFAPTLPTGHTWARKGVRPLVRRTCDGIISIPLAGKVGSLNVSVAAAVLLYEAARQRQSGPDNASYNL